MATKINEIIKRTVKHRATIAPWECGRCGFIWYGGAGKNPLVPETTLCSGCWGSLYSYMYDRHKDIMYVDCTEEKIREEIAAKIHTYAAVWVQDNKLILSDRRRFHSSVPKWMRSAINAKMVTPNDHNVYTVYSINNKAEKAEKVEIEHGKEA